MLYVRFHPRRHAIVCRVEDTTSLAVRRGQLLVQAPNGWMFLVTVTDPIPPWAQDRAEAVQSLDAKQLQAFMDSLPLHRGLVLSHNRPMYAAAALLRLGQLAMTCTSVQFKALCAYAGIVDPYAYDQATFDAGCRMILAAYGVLA